ncbi:DUF1513 domain-containing protein (plasmid) [Pseudoalteromonas sp. T1lg65]|uniref:DUF1513 domain-containing protein n=1 Tax=Pseudoalteromonas sp. T1lg65 TaxID=2077101 RepID=UPI003F799627
MQLSRRSFCKATLAMGAGTLMLSTLSACSVGSGKQRYASAYTSNSGKHHVSWFDIEGHVQGDIQIPQRAHDLAFAADDGLLIAFARRPGDELYLINVDEGLLQKVVKARPKHHFYGHGVVDKSRKLLFTSENYFDDSLKAHHGKVVVRKLSDMSIINEFNSGGIGPHQIALLSDGETLVVANGGIHTHPSMDRRKLNVDSMQPNLTYLDTRSGAVKRVVTPPHHQLSTRHLCVSADDTVYVGCQFQGPEALQFPLIYKDHISQNNGLMALQATETQWRAFSQYTASLSFNERLQKLAVTSPRGGIVSIWDGINNSLQSLYSLDDTAGLAVTNDGFIATDGQGGITIAEQKLSNIVRVPCHWDNHLLNLV